MRILVTGASGLLGLNFCMQAATQHNVMGVYHQQAIHSDRFEAKHSNLLDKSQLIALLEEFKPNWLLHTAALAGIDDCEEAPEMANALNYELPKSIAEETKKRGVGLLHISTDAVFDGKQGNYHEDSPTQPLSEYARTKLAAEEAIKQIYPEAMIARTVFYGWSLSGTRSLAEYFINGLEAHSSTPGYTNAYFSPLHVSHLVSYLLAMMEKNLEGLYHAVSPEYCSKYEFGIQIAKRFGLEASLIKAVENLAPIRSKNLVLSPQKLHQALNRPLAGIQKGIDLLYMQALDGTREKIRAARAHD